MTQTEQTPTPSPEVKEYKPSEQVLHQIEESFTYHSPLPDQIPRYGALRSKAKELALLMAKNCPPGRELAMALTQLQLATMCANAAIACNEKGVG